MKNKKIIYLFVCAIVCSLSICPPASPQTSLASVTGWVLDPNAAFIIEATVAAKNVDTGIEITVQTNEVGIYHFANLDPGNYEFSVSKRGFKVIVKPAVTLHVGDTVSMNFTMQVGDIRETVTVEAGAPMINTTDGSVSTVVDQTYLKNMPINGRSFQDLILLTPGIVTNSPQGGSNGGEFSVNGQRTEANYYTVDGVSANVGVATGLSATGASSSGSLGTSTALGTTQALVSVDSLQEFRVQSSTYSAEYGRNLGGQFAFETKSGTNQWHGTAFDYLRNDMFDAADYFTNYFRSLNPDSTKPATRQNDFGGTLGGPVRIPRLYNGKDKTFFFVSYEGLRLAQPQPTAASYVPDLCMRGAGPCPVVMENGVNVQRMPAASALLPAMNAFPLPSPSGLEDDVDGIGQFIGGWSNPSSIDSTSVRFDDVVNEKLRLFFRFSNTSSSTAARGGGGIGGFPPTVNVISDYAARTYTAGANSIFSTRLSNEIRLNYTSNAATSNQVIEKFGGSTPVDLAQLSSMRTDSGVTFGFLFGAFPGLVQFPSSGSQKQWNLVDTVSFSFGRHQFRFGADYRRLASFANFPTNLSYLFFSEPDVEANNTLAITQANTPAFPLYKNFSAFAQDQWKVSERLTISMGLRWEVNPAPSVTRGLMPYTAQGSGPDTWALVPQGTPLWKTTWYNFAPRLGAAYILRDSRGFETVIRGGGGVYFDSGQQAGSLGFNGPGFSALAFTFGSFPVDGPSTVPAVTNPPVTPYDATVFFFPTHLQLPYTLQWNASVDQSLGRAQALSVSYVGSHAARLLKQDVFSVPQNPNGNNFNFIQNGSTSDYDSLQFQFRRQLSQGLTALASYTWSHCIDYGSNNYAFGYQRGNCAFDVRHNLSAAFSYDLPNVGNNWFSKAVLHHWGIDDRFIARSGFPVPLSGVQLLQPDGRTYSAGLDLVPGQPLYLYGYNCATVLQGLGDLVAGQGCPGGRAINPQAFTSVTTGFGDAPRNFARGFDAVQMNLAVRREFHINENLKLQFRAETFNLFNHPVFGTINTQFGQPTFGQATSTMANSLGGLNSLYQTGGPRSMQFALKLYF